MKIEISEHPSKFLGSPRYLPIDINSHDYMGRSVMSKAIQTANIEMVRLLFKLDEGKILNHGLLELFDIIIYTRIG